MNDISIRIGNCDECEDLPITIEGWYKEEIYYGRDIRQEEYDQLKDIIEEVQDIVTDMVEHDQAQNQVS